MDLATLTKPFAYYLSVPSESELSEWKPTHDKLNVNSDYLEVLQSGVLRMDLDKVEVNWKKVAKTQDLSWITQDIASLGRAQSATKESLPEIFDDYFYIVGSTFGASSSCNSLQKNMKEN